MEALGPVLIVLSLPLLLRWVPRNSLMGLRVPATLRNDTIWYDVNAFTGRWGLLLGVAMVALEFVLPVSIRNPVLATIGLMGLLGLSFMGWRRANRMARDMGVSPWRLT